MSKWLMFVLCFFQLVSLAQDKVLPKEATAFLPAGYEVLDYIRGDLNGDSRQDAILILKEKGEDSAYDEAKRPFLLLTRKANGKLKMAKRTDETILCRQCGGIFGDPYDYVDITNKGFTVHFYGGSSWRWSSTYSFRYNPAMANWYLVNEKQVSYHNTEIDLTMKEVNIGAAELGVKTIDSFNCNAPIVQSKWKVVADKAYFYNNPKDGSKPRKAYLVKGDSISVHRELNHFVWAYFENNKDQPSSGFILKKALVKIK